MISIKDPSDCCGCTACATVCGRHAITMIPDAQGFLYPVVDSTKCLDCGLCNAVCAFKDDYDVNSHYTNPIVYAARHKDIVEVEKSRSGAVFVAVSDYILENGGSVYGACQDGVELVLHKRAISKQERDEMRGSKYVQSVLADTFRNVRLDLKDGLLVLFSGTPCQTAGLRSYLNITKTDMSNLFVMDVVCHGTPSQFYYRDYLSYIERRHGKIVSINFRDKKNFGWGSHKESFILETGKLVSDRFSFYQQLFLRESCSVCHFSNIIRPSDITIGDFWGWEKVAPSLNRDDKGISLVLVNSPKGKKIFDIVSDRMSVIESSVDMALQPNLQHPTPMHPAREQFCRDYVADGFEKACRNQMLIGPKADIIRIVYKIKKLINKNKK